MREKEKLIYELMLIFRHTICASIGKELNLLPDKEILSIKPTNLANALANQRLIDASKVIVKNYKKSKIKEPLLIFENDKLKINQSVFTMFINKPVISKYLKLAEFYCICSAGLKGNSINQSVFNTHKSIAIDSDFNSSNKEIKYFLCQEGRIKYSKLKRE